MANQPNYSSRYAYHEADLIWAMESWDWFASFTGEPMGYQPTAGDRAQSALLRRLWLEFARGEPHPAGLPPLLSRPPYVVGLVGKAGLNLADGWLDAACGELKAAKLTKFQWSN